MQVLTTVLAETEFARELPMDPIWYGVIALVVFAALGFVTWSYRDVANRHREKAEAYAARVAAGEEPDHQH
ncbi:hypothetical protein ARHIZOSPH14_31230 [Agromyces rhizosphaerae]|uniref:Heme exporter protein D n=1 Tax=Agromyces rhizosphaerae TaxID=88374 RepID=A0A9W6CZL2_9MICO|nr:hypothetical protein [Agromyces rhizosphaerae]GLI28881.1 hypothetical protein ARHIZOSPH14_31230 [Agromyces rhizosphaerae]